jgi:hypothetical protein
MKQEEKGFRRNFQKFRTSAKNVPCSTKLPLYWQLIEECMKKMTRIENLSEKNGGSLVTNEY